MYSQLYCQFVMVCTVRYVHVLSVDLVINPYSFTQFYLIYPNYLDGQA